MKTYEELYEEEKSYLDKVISFLEEELSRGGAAIQDQRRSLVNIRKEMWTEGANSATEIERAVELNQYQTMEAVEASKYKHQFEKLKKYRKILDKPYFARFDFAEEGEEEEPIYIGYHNLMDDETHEVLAYDWRTPIASIFYRNEIGKASYQAPCGEIKGELTLKRQYEIRKGILEYFFDCSLTITDEILQQALSKNASSKMKNIVETIQKEQDQIIRDRENDLLMVQGVAGSGKTSVAMHRVAFLLYDGMGEGLRHNNIAVISPNSLFSEYISSVLPELGEENSENLTIEDLFKQYLGKELQMLSRSAQMEYVITSRNRSKVRKNIEFKGSHEFIAILDRLIDVFEHKLLAFDDVYYDGQIVENKQRLKNQFLNNKINMSIAKRLDRIETILLDKLEPMIDKKKQDILDYLEKKGGYEFEEKKTMHYLLYKQKQGVLKNLKGFTRVDIFELYYRLFKDKELFARMSKGLELPKNIEDVRKHTLKVLRRDRIPYEDGAALLYLSLKIEGKNLYPHIKQVLVDEAQDYYPLHYSVFGMLFKGAQYTVLGDIRQTIEKSADISLYDEIVKILKPKNALRLTLTKSYRSSYEINSFSQKLRGDETASIPFERHEEIPEVINAENESQLHKKLMDKIQRYREEGLESIAVLCKTQAEAHKVYCDLIQYMDIQKVTEEDTFLGKGVRVMPIYMAKGLEYDAVIVYEVNEKKYQNSFDKQLLYIACTRALHRLSLFYTEELTKYLK